MENRFMSVFFWSALVLAGGTLIGAVLLLAGAVLALVLWNPHWLWLSMAGIALILFVMWATLD